MKLDLTSLQFHENTKTKSNSAASFMQKIGNKIIVAYQDADDMRDKWNALI